MGYYDDVEKVKQYIDISKEYDGRALVDVLCKYLKKGSSLLEIGMGPGKDLDLLSDYYLVTGSDSSQVFIDYYRERKADVELLQLDAVSLDTNKTFDCIYSNKVLQHLTIDEHIESIKSQFKLLNSGGIIFHTFWYGRGEEEYGGLRFKYYDESMIESMYNEDYEILDICKYTEDELNDSMYLIARKK